MEPDEAPDIELPRGIALAWGVAASPQRGPKRELSIERIVDTAVEIADESGLGAVSMSSVAGRLGFTTMSLYRYVTAKDDLILLMQEHGIGLPPLNISEGATWRERLTRWTHETLAVYAGHPWLLDIPVSSMPNTPNNLAWFDAALQALDGTSLSEQERIAVTLMMTGHSRWQAQIIRGYSSAEQSGMSPAERDQADAHIVATLVTEAQFPSLYRLIQTGVLADDHDPFEFGLSRILDGLESYMAGIGDGTAVRAQAPIDKPTDGYPRDAAVKLARQTRREAESRLREALAREREAIKRAREKEKHAAEAAARAAAKRG